MSDELFEKKKELACLIKDFCLKNNLEGIFSIYDSDNNGERSRPVEMWIGMDSRAMAAFHFLNEFIFLKVARHKEIRKNFLEGCNFFLKRLEHLINQPEDEIIKKLGFEFATFDEFSEYIN